MLKQNIKIFLRNIKRQKSSFLINVIGLSTGLACVLLIALWVSDELSIDKFHDNDTRLYQVVELAKTDGTIRMNPVTSGLLAEALAQKFPEIEQETSVRAISESPLKVDDKDIKTNGLYASKDFFKVFSYSLISGNINDVLVANNSIAISKSLARILFGSADNTIGKTIYFERDKPFFVSGVFEDVPHNSSMQFDYVISFEYAKETMPPISNWDYNKVNAYIVLRKGVNISSFNAKIKDFIATNSDNDNRSVFTRLYSDAYLYGTYENGVQVGGRIEYVRLFSIIAFLILLMACINYMNLSTANASKRIKEIGIKKALGSKRKVLIVQYLSESLLTTFLSLLIAVLIVVLLIPQFNIITGKELSLTVNGRYLTSIIGIMILTGLIAGSYPAFYLSGLNTIKTLKGTLKSTWGEVFTRKGLVVFQFTLSIILVVSVMVIYKQIEFVQNKNLGYDKNNIVYFDIEQNIAENLDSFLAETKNLEGIENASSIGTNIVGGVNTWDNLQWPEKMSDEKIVFEMRPVNYGMLETLGIGLKKGRNFSKDFGAETTKIIFNQAAIDIMGLEDPIGKEVSIQGTRLQIVGVTDNFHFTSLHEQINPLFFVLQPTWTHMIMAKVSPGKEKEALANIRRLYQKYNPGLQLDYRFLDDTYQSLYTAEQRVSTLSKYFAGLAILISCLGLFGLVKFNAERRKKEISIRKVLGQTATQVTVMLSSEFAKLVLFSIFLALPFSYLLVKDWLSDFAYRIPLSFWYFIGAGAIALVVAILTVSFQSIKAAISNPVKNLRTE
ncbi:ABC transporter permease [Galbibacter sp. EGI 63066]|uniref:ABC transporter permease n=1 Tax=Galbibacter sp. EGI 63066 TaxID=2993559 RepID=UPI00224961BC|nr:ABC transporter permease [Galbibacter sp. EGI 63066]MCX2681747.1 ABC transporter permease [Galbibacter sp. EGI 63066]